MVNALPDDKVKEIIYHIVLNLCRTKQDYFETWVKTLEAKVPAPATKKISKKGKKEKLQEIYIHDLQGSWQKIPMMRKLQTRWKYTSIVEVEVIL